MTTRITRDHNVVDDCREYAKDPAKWVHRYQDQCRFHEPLNPDKFDPNEIGGIMGAAR